MALLLRANKVVAGSPDEIIVESGQIIIGSLHSSHLVIAGQDVAPIHAMVEVDSATGTTQLIEMDPDGALKLNGKPIDVVEPLKHGDVIEIGPVRIEVFDAERTPPLPRTPDADRATTVAKPGAPKSDGSAGRATQKAPPGVVRKPNRVVHGAIFVPGKERPGGSTLEVVAYWDQSILDVRHYGGTPKKGENERPSEVYIGNETDGHLIGVGPRADTRSYKFAEVRGNRTSIFLNGDMRAKIRRGGSYDKVQGSKTVEISNKDVALVKHGPISYFLMSVNLPNPTLRKLADIDGKPIIFLYALFVYLGTVAGLMSLGAPAPKTAEEDAWATILKIATPPPPPPKEVPAPKPPVEVKKPEPIPKPPKIVEPPKPKPAPPSTTPKEPKPVEVRKPTALQKPVPPQPEDSGKTAPKGEKKANDTALGRKNPSLSPGNGGGPRGGTAGAFAGQRSGNEKSDMMGVEGGKKNVMSGMNLEKLGQGIGRVSDVDGIAKINVGQQSTGGGAGGGAGSGRNAHGFGGLGNQNSLSTGGPAQALAGLGGGAGGMGAGGLGGPGGSGNGRGGRGSGPRAEAVVVPEGDPAVEGGLTKEEIEAVIRANLAQIKACYERNLQGNRDLAGRVLTNFVIGGNGAVKSSRVVSSTLGSPGAESCIVGAIRRWKFPLPRGGGDVDVKYPFVFTPQR